MPEPLDVLEARVRTDLRALDRRLSAEQRAGRTAGPQTDWAYAPRNGGCRPRRRGTEPGRRGARRPAGRLRQAFVPHQERGAAAGRSAPAPPGHRVDLGPDQRRAGRQHARSAQAARRSRASRARSLPRHPQHEGSHTSTMNKRLRARTQRRTPTTRVRSRGLVDLVNLKVCLSLVPVKVIFACRAPILPCPHFRSWPQVSTQPLLQARHCAEVREHLAGQHSVHRQPVDARLAFHSAQGETPLRQRLLEPKHERLRVTGTGGRSRFEVSRGPLASGDVLAGSGVTSRPRHGLRLPNRPCAVPAPCYGGGYYKIHHRESLCLVTSSSGATS